MVAPLWALNTIKNCAPRKSGPKFNKFFRRCYSTKPLTKQNFVAIGYKMIENLSSPKKWAKVGKSSPKFCWGCYTLRSPIVPNFIEIGQTSLEKSVKKRYFFGPSRHFFCHGQKCNYLSRVLQCARGATKKIVYVNQ